MSSWHDARRSRSRAGRGSLKSDAGGRAEVVQHAVLAARQPGEADPPAVPDQQMREDPPLRARDEPQKVALDPDRVILARQPKPLREPANVRVPDGLEQMRVSEIRKALRLWAGPQEAKLPALSP